MYEIEVTIEYNRGKKKVKKTLIFATENDLENHIRVLTKGLSKEVKITNKQYKLKCN